MTTMVFPGEEIVPRVDRAVELLDHWARRQGDTTFDALGARRRTYRQAAVEVDRCAAALRASGVRRGDRVAVLSTPRPEFLTVFLALSRIGAVWLGLNPAYTTPELSRLLADAQPILLLVLVSAGGGAGHPDLEKLRAAAPSVREIVTVDGASGTPTFEEFLGRGGSESGDAAGEVDPDAPAMIIYTSGTTGRPKGAMISHRAFATGCWLQGSYYYHPRPVVLANLPVSHVAGVMDLGCIPIAMGGTVQFAEAFDPRGVLELIERERVTMWGQVPPIFHACASLPEFRSTDLSSLRYVAWGGAPMPLDLVTTLRRTGARLGTVYGLTESCVSVAYNDPGADDETLAHTIGRPDPRLEFRIADDSDRPVPFGQSGEIQLRNPCLMSGYLGLPDATRCAFTADGFLRTGDVAVQRDDGNVELVGRLTETFGSGGYNVYPREIEAVLENHEDVAMAAVVAVPDPVYHEVGVACVVPAAGRALDTDELFAHCGANLARYKVPKRFHQLDELPLLAIGKVDRNAVRERLRETGLEPEAGSG